MERKFVSKDYPYFFTDDELWPTKLLSVLDNPVCLIAGLGGNTGTQTIQEIARLAKADGKRVYALVISPFHSESSKRSRLAEEAIAELQAICDEVYVLSNQEKMVRWEMPKQTTIADYFDRCNKYILGKVLQWVY